jgi:hypothetical protein
LAKGDVIVSVKYKEVFFTAVFLGDEMLGRGHWENTDFHPFSTRKSCHCIRFNSSILDVNVDLNIEKIPRYKHHLNHTSM